MLDVMSQAKNAIETYNAALKVSLSNMANMETHGYKRLNVSFQSIFEKVLSQGTAASDTAGGTNPRQFGQGVAISGVTVDFSSGIPSSAAPLNLSISGQGLFIVSPDGGETFHYTRAGDFELDSAGNLVTGSGMQVYGLNSANSLVPITGLTPSLYNTNLLSWTDAGELAEFTTSDFKNVSKTTSYRIALTYFQNPSGLAQAKGSAFAATLASGSAATAQAIGGAAGTVLPRQLEASNVDQFSETLYAQEISRAMSANLSMVKLASDMVSSFIQKLG